MSAQTSGVKTWKRCSGIVRSWPSLDDCPGIKDADAVGLGPGCPPVCSVKTFFQRFESCAICYQLRYIGAPPPIGSSVYVPTRVLGCVTWGHECSLTYIGFGGPCLMTCKKKRTPPIPGNPDVKPLSVPAVLRLGQLPYR
jgi:hypothetical protein